MPLQKEADREKVGVIPGLLFDRFSDIFIFVWSILLMVTVDWEVPLFRKAGRWGLNKDGNRGRFLFCISLIYNDVGISVNLMTTFFFKVMLKW